MWVSLNEKLTNILKKLHKVFYMIYLPLNLSLKRTEILAKLPATYSNFRSDSGNVYIKIIKYRQTFGHISALEIV